MQRVNDTREAGRKPGGAGLPKDSTTSPGNYPGERKRKKKVRAGMWMRRFLSFRSEAASV